MHSTSTEEPSVISNESLDVRVHMLSRVSLSTLFCTGSCCIICLVIDSYSPRLSAPRFPPFALRLVAFSSHIYLAGTHPPPTYRFTLSLCQCSSPSSPPGLSVKGWVFTVWGFIRSAWTALTLVMRLHYWSRVRDPSSERLSSILSWARTPCLFLSPHAETQHARAASAGVSVACQQRWSFNQMPTEITHYICPHHTHHVFSYWSRCVKPVPSSSMCNTPDSLFATISSTLARGLFVMFNDAAINYTPCDSLGFECLKHSEPRKGFKVLFYSSTQRVVPFSYKTPDSASWFAEYVF